MALIDVPHLDLEDALAILTLMAREGDGRRDAWAARWLQRAGTSQRERLERCLERLPEESAHDELSEVARQLRGSHSAIH